MKIYMIRHGESEANRKKIHGGWLQVNLTEKGIADAKRAGEYLSKIKFDKIYSSDLIRAMQTAEHALPGCEYETLMLVREVSVGSLAGKYPVDCVSEHGESYLTNKKNRDYRPYGGECEDDLIRHAGEFFSMKELRNYECVAVFTHEGFIRASLEYTLGTSVANSSIASPNCMISSFELTDTGVRLLGWNLY